MKDDSEENQKTYNEMRYWMNKYFGEANKNVALERKANIVIALSLTLIAVVLAISVFVVFSPVEVKVGDVCLSCWGK